MIGVGIRGVGVTGALSLAGKIRAMFRNGEQGWVYDPSDFNRYMDQLGPELVTNGDFSGGTTGWVDQSSGTGSFTVVDGAARISHGASGSGRMRQSISTVAGRQYRITFNAVMPGARTCFNAGTTAGGDQVLGNQIFGTGQQSLLITAISTTTWINYFTQSPGDVYTFDNISVKELTAISTATLFQDAAGTTPVTAMEQPLGLQLDLRNGLPWDSAELAVNTDSEAGPITFPWDGLTRFSSKTQSTDRAFSGTYSTKLTATAGSGTHYWNVMSVPANTTVCVSGKIYIPSGAMAGQPLRVVDTSDGSFITDLVLGTSTDRWVSFSFIRPGKATQWPLGLGHNVAADWGTNSIYFDDVSVKLLAGNHRYQTTSANRPVVSARVNLLTATETLATQTVTTRATKQTLTFTGAGSITLSGTATGTYTAGTYSVTTTAGSLTLTVSGTVTQADLRPTNQGVNLPSYQRVNTSTDYDTAGFPIYIKANGSNQFMVSNAIDFTATDKMTVWAGVRKLSDAAGAILAELSSAYTTYVGSFFLSAPNDATTQRYGAISRGNIGVNAGQGSYVTGVGGAADTANLTALFDISGDSTIIRRNGTAFAAGTADQGTGKYGNYAAYHYARGGTSLFFNGHDYGSICRGAASSAAQITAAEGWINQRTKAF